MSLFKNLSLVTKVVFMLSLLVLFAWVIPTMVSYYTGVKNYQNKTKVLKHSLNNFGIKEESKSFDPYAFKTMLLNTFNRAEIESISESSYTVTVEFTKKNLGLFNDLVETLSLRYWVKITSPLIFEEKEESIEARMTIEKID